MKPITVWWIVSISNLAITASMWLSREYFRRSGDEFAASQFLVSAAICTVWLSFSIFKLIECYMEGGAKK